MLDALNITEADAQGLCELAEHDLAMARDFARRAQAAEDPDEANRLARSYQRAARSFRQTLAMKVKLQRDLAQAQAQSAQAVAAAPRAPPRGAAVARRLGELRTALLRVAWDEAERPEDERAEGGRPEGERDEETFAWHVEEIASCLATECLQDSFVDEPLDDHVARLSLAMGLSPEPALRWRDLPDPPRAAVEQRFDYADEPWLSSA